jgi:hypothetical protein
LRAVVRSVGEEAKYSFATRGNSIFPGTDARLYDATVAKERLNIKGSRKVRSTWRRK